MTHEFKIIRNGILETYTNYDDVPNSFDHLIKFAPVIPPEPHTDEQHEEIEEWHNKIKKLMEIELASSNKKR